MATSKETLKIAVKIMKRIRRSWEMYEDECAEYAKQGYRPHYCFHGVDQWTDYDNICGWCEEVGNGWDYVQALKQALAEAEAAVEAKQKRVDLLITVQVQKMPVEDWGKLLEWAHEPLAKYDEL